MFLTGYTRYGKNNMEKEQEKIIDFIFKEPTLDLKIKRFDFWKKEIGGKDCI